MCSLAVTAEGEWRKTWNRTLGLLPEHKAEKQEIAAWVTALASCPEAQSLINEVLALPDASMPPAEVAALAALSQVLRLAAAELQLEFAAQGRVDFTAIAAAARAALTEQGQPTDLALRFGSDIRHILIDEFQDTSLEQFELLQRADGWLGCGRRAHVVCGRRSDAVDLPVPRGGGRPVPARARSWRRRLASRRAAAATQFPLRAAAGRVGQSPLWRGVPGHDDARLAAIRYLPALAAHADRMARSRCIRCHLPMRRLKPSRSHRSLPSAVRMIRRPPWRCW